MTTTLATAVSSRVKTLIARHHCGNRFAAAYALGVDQEGLAGLLSGDWRRFSLHTLAALVRGYDVSLDWLLAAPTVEAAEVPVRRRRRPRASERASERTTERTTERASERANERATGGPTLAVVPPERGKRAREA
jgi:hypothetical protein